MRILGYIVMIKHLNHSLVLNVLLAAVRYYYSRWLLSGSLPSVATGDRLRYVYVKRLSVRIHRLPDTASMLLLRVIRT